MRRKNSTSKTIRVRASLRGNVAHVEVLTHKNQITPTTIIPIIQKKIKAPRSPSAQPNSLLP
jgi:hypothetical protein